MTSPENPTDQDAQRDPMPTPMGGPATREGTTPSVEGDMLGSGANTGFDDDSHSRDSDPSTADTAKGEGRQVAGEAKEGGQHVAGVAKEEATKVASTVGEQAKSLLSQSRSELSDQAGTQKQRLAEGLKSFSDELDSMAQNSEQSGPATDLARQASQHTQALAGWLQDHEPDAVLDEVKRFAQKRPGTFILVAAGVGLAAGRLTRGLTSDSDDAPNASGQGHPAGGDPYRQDGTQPGFVDDGVDDPDTAAGYPDDEDFAVGRPIQDGSGLR